MMLEYIFQRRKRKILVVENDRLWRSIVVKQISLIKPKCFVEMAQDGDEAVAKIKETQYDLVLTDYRMPDIDGIQLATIIRMTTPKTRIVVMTSYGTKELLGEIKRLNLDGFVKKPFSVKKQKRLSSKSFLINLWPLWSL